MATVTCPTCHTRFGVGKGFARCPECGEPLDVERKKIPVPTWVWALVALGSLGAIAFTIGSVLPGRTKIEKLSEVAHPVAADILATAYRDNEVSADLTYRNKTVMVIGTVDRVGKDLANGPYLVLKTDAGLSQILCRFDKKEEKPLAKLRPNDIVTICGTCTGKLNHILLGDCWIVP